MAKKSAAGGTPATVALDQAGIQFSTHSYRHDPAAASYGLEAAEALGVAPERVFKTLMLRLEPDEFALAMLPVDAQLSLKAAASALGAKRAVMADAAVAERRTGYVLGGISPLGQRQRHRLVADASLLQHATVFCSGGRRGFEIELAGTDLITLTSGTTAEIAVRS